MHRDRSGHRHPIALGMAMLAALAGCGSDGPTAADSDVRPAEQLHFLRPAADAPPLANPVVSFYAKRGEDREAFIYYRPRPGRTDSTEFVRFKVPGGSLDRRPDGTAFVLGDSILITVRVSDPARLILDFQPSGLRFSANDPAPLKIRFNEASDDIDGDGDVDADDDLRKTELSIWKQEAAGLPWYRLTSVLDFSTDQVEAKLLGFTGYAISY